VALLEFSLTEESAEGVALLLAPFGVPVAGRKHCDEDRRFPDSFFDVGVPVSSHAQLLQIPPDGDLDAEAVRQLFAKAPLEHLEPGRVVRVRVASNIWSQAGSSACA
jgi:hypothetical protein